LFCACYMKMVMNSRSRLFSLGFLIFLYLVAWLLIFIPGYFFASNPFFFLAVLGFIVVMFKLVWRKNKKLALALTAITLLVFGYSLSLWFEESYCCGKGEQAERKFGNRLLLEPTEEERRLYNLSEDTRISPAYREHMRCHREFDFWKALKEEYLFYEK